MTIANAAISYVGEGQELIILEGDALKPYVRITLEIMNARRFEGENVVGCHGSG